MNYEVEERVDRLESLLSQFIVQTNTALNISVHQVSNNQLFVHFKEKSHV